jgi:hypothetical protein
MPLTSSLLQILQSAHTTTTTTKFRVYKKNPTTQVRFKVWKKIANKTFTNYNLNPKLQERKNLDKKIRTIEVFTLPQLQLCQIWHHGAIERPMWFKWFHPPHVNESMSICFKGFQKLPYYLTWKAKVANWKY